MKIPSHIQTHLRWLGIAVTIAAVFAIRRYGTYEDYIGKRFPANFHLPASYRLQHAVFPFFVVLVPVVYFLPSYVAWQRKKANALAIFLLNLFVGWTLAGWVGALVWASLRERIDDKPRAMA